MLVNLPFIGVVAAGKFLAGAGSVVFARPLLVGAARVGYAVTDEARALWSSAKAQAGSIREEARTRRVEGDEAEVARLRAEIAELKAARRA
jgi:hypothetical protein